MDPAVNAAPPAHTPQAELPETKLSRIISSAEKWVIVVVLLAMSVLPVLETISRWAFKRGVPGSLLYTQQLTLWIGFLGALLATKGGKHLALATGEFIPEGKLKNAATVYVGALAAGVSAMLAYASAKLIVDTAAFSSMLPGGVPEWVSQLVMPLALTLISIRFALRASPRWRGRIVALLTTLPAILAMLMVLENESLDAVITPIDDWLSEISEGLVWPGIVLIILGVVLGAPVFVAMAGIAMLLFFSEGTPIASVPTETYRLVASPTLPAIPLLTVAGYILAEGGASRRLIRLARAWIGWMPGGMALMVVFVLAAFTTFTGGSGVTILALGGLVFPMLISEKYPEGFSLGLVTSSGSLGLLFPPSLPVILYAVVAGASVEELFIAGFVPCLLLIVLVAIYGVIAGVKAKAPRTPFDAKEAFAALWGAKWELAIPAVVVLAIFTGFATIVESAALAVVAAVVSQSFVYKELHPIKQLPSVLVHAATLVGAVLILLGVAMGMTSWLVDAEIPAALIEWTSNHIKSKWVFLLALNAVLLVLGSVLEIYAAIAVLAPLIAPMAREYGIDPLHLGIVFLANLELGFLFPPMGLNLILASSRFNQPLRKLYKVALPYLLIMAVGVLLVTYIPAMTTGVLHWVKGTSAQVVEPSDGFP